MVPLQVTDVVGARAVHPAAVAVRYGLAVLVVGAIPGEHGVHGGDGVLTVVRRLHCPADGGAYRQGLEGAVVGLGAEVEALVVEALDSTLLLIVADGEEGVEALATALHGEAVVLGHTGACG